MKMPAHTPATSSTFLDAVKFRRTVYGVTDQITIPDERIIDIVNEVVQSSPSSWNIQSTRVLVTLGKEHKRFWDVVMDSAKPAVLKSESEEDWKRQETRFKSFREAYGTISLFEERSDIEKLHQKFTKFPFSVFEQFAEHSNAMNQINLWTALELDGLGASLQHTHFVPGVEAGIKSAFKIPSSWSIKAQIVFGGMPGEMPSVPEKKSLTETVKVYK